MAPGRWNIDAIKGNYNAPVTKRVEEAAAAVLRALEEAHALLPPTRAEMFRARHGESAAAVRGPAIAAGNAVGLVA
jgi:hypothetical protein